VAGFRWAMSKKFSPKAGRTVTTSTRFALQIRTTRHGLSVAFTETLCARDHIFGRAFGTMFERG
jgi:hypothetical protein